MRFHCQVAGVELKLMSADHTTYFPFMFVAPEIRNKIYRFMVIEEDGVVATNLPRRTHLQHVSNHRYARRKLLNEGCLEKPEHYRIPPYEFGPEALFGVSKQVRHEAASIYYSENTFKFNDLRTLENFLSCAERNNPLCHALLRKVDFRWTTGPRVSIFEAFRRFEGLRFLTIRVNETTMTGCKNIRTSANTVGRLYTSVPGYKELLKLRNLERLEVIWGINIDPESRMNFEQTLVKYTTMTPEDAEAAQEAEKLAKKEAKKQATKAKRLAAANNPVRKAALAAARAARRQAKNANNA